MICISAAAEPYSPTKKCRRIPAAAEKGKIIFERLDDYRRGPEQIVAGDDKATVSELANGRISPLVRLGTYALEGLAANRPEERGIFTDTFMAVQLDALAQPQESAA
ncbi:MAG: hypothetical protein WDN27_06570 [Candidatus Saccharibacteria bacterium]